MACTNYTSINYALDLMFESEFITSDKFQEAFPPELEYVYIQLSTSDCVFWFYTS